MDCSPLGSSVHGIFQARIVEWVALSFSRRSSPIRDRTCVSCIGRQSLYRLSHQGSPYYKMLGGRELPAAAAAKLLQSCPTLCNPIDRSPPGSPVPGILQARTLEWVAISYCRESSQPRDGICLSHSSCIGRWILYHVGNGQPSFSGQILRKVQSPKLKPGRNRNMDRPTTSTETESIILKLTTNNNPASEASQVNSTEHLKT